jgi:hypothetical protein
MAYGIRECNLLKILLHFRFKTIKNRPVIDTLDFTGADSNPARLPFSIYCGIERQFAELSAKMGEP